MEHRTNAVKKLEIPVFKPPLATARAAYCIGAVHLFVCLSVAKMQKTRLSQKLELWCLDDL